MGLLPGLKFSNRTSDFTASFFTNLFMVRFSTVQRSSGSSLSTLLLPKINRDTLLIASNAPPPGADAVDIKFPPNPKRVTNTGRFNLDHVRSEVPIKQTKNS